MQLRRIRMILALTGLLVAFGFGILIVNSNAGGISPSMQRDILAAGMQASHNTLTKASMEWDGKDYRTCQEAVRHALKQMEASSRDAGIKLKKQ